MGKSEETVQGRKPEENLTKTSVNIGTVKEKVMTKPLESPSAMANLQAKSWPHRLRPSYPQLYYSLPPPLRQGSAKAH
ncbi:hypothetical protein ROHU_029781 [Labeo rohita]|uniref:Uncharacterized protein n=1 Tax=Labeo rohita TaxID=84645 RepID=A0A498LWR0_LABRO|nr:hypothetical protein ROHU_029781 [Labeo rohita]